jgi:hypothetical protein
MLNRDNDCIDERFNYYSTKKDLCGNAMCFITAFAVIAPVYIPNALGVMTFYLKLGMASPQEG